MSKKKGTKKVVVIVLAVIVCLVLAVVAVCMLKSWQIRDRIDSRYSAVELPAWLYLSDKKYYDDQSYWDGPEAKNVKQNWTYTYLPIAKEVPLEEMCNIVAKSLKDAGYSTTETSHEMSGAYATLHATGKNLKLNVNISTYPARDGSASKSIVQSVDVQAYE